MHEGAWSARLGIPGRPAEAESSIVARDLALAKLTGGRYHVLHVSSAADGRRWCAPRRPRACASPRSARPQHLVLTDAVVRRIRPGVQDEPAAARAGATSTRCARALLDGTIDAIATDHAPHTPETKAVPFEEAPPGHARGRDRARRRAHDARRARACSRSPTRSARCRGARRASPASTPHGHGGPIAAGRPANLCVIDPAHALGRSTRTRLASRVDATRPGTSGSSPARSATPSSAASPPSVTASPPNDTTSPTLHRLRDRPPTWQQMLASTGRGSGCG